MSRRNNSVYYRHPGLIAGILIACLCLLAGLLIFGPGSDDTDTMRRVWISVPLAVVAIVVMLLRFKKKRENERSDGS